MSNAKEELEALEAEVQRIRNRRKSRFDKDKLRAILNTIFLFLAGIGIVLYVNLPAENHGRVPALALIGMGMFVKIMEFILRFTA